MEDLVGGPRGTGKKISKVRSSSLQEGAATLVPGTEEVRKEDGGSAQSSRVSGTVFTPPSGLRLVLDVESDHVQDTPIVTPRFPKQRNKDDIIRVQHQRSITSTF